MHSSHSVTSLPKPLQSLPFVRGLRSTFPTAPVVRRYVSSIALVGFALLPWMAVVGFKQLQEAGASFWLFAFLLMAGELFPIAVPRQGDIEEITISSTFSFAIMISAGTPAAVLATCVASATADLAHKKPEWKVLFNVGQYAITTTLAGVAYRLLGGSAVVSSGDIGPLLVSAFIRFILNDAVTGVGVGLAQKERVLEYLRRDLGFQSLTAVMLLGMAPVCVIVASRTIVFVPLLLLPVLAVYKGTSTAVKNVELVTRLKESLVELGQLNQLNEYQALHDMLTGLPNRTAFGDRISQAIAAASREEERVGVMVLDLDRFKEVNDTLGHRDGDVLLQQVGARLHETLRASDTVARIGGDEFGVLLPRLQDEADALQVALEIRKDFEQPFLVKGLTFEVEPSIGLATYPGNGTAADILLQRADLAMDAAKASRRGVATYTPEYDQYSPSRLALLGELRRAMESAQLVLHYQPKAAMRDRRVTGVEALVRWDHPERGLIGPLEFVPFAEHTSLIGPLTTYVLDRALHQVHEWREKGLELPVAVNLSVRNLLDPKLPALVGELLDKWEIPPSYLELEITESILMAEPRRAMEVLLALRSMGVRMALDDFGTGFSSLAYLKRLPVHEIKVDKSFVLGMQHDESDATIVKSTIDLGRNLGLDVVAEGVETEGTWNALEELGCPMAQGYYLTPPVLPGDLEAWLEKHRSSFPLVEGSGPGRPGLLARGVQTS